MIGGTDDRFATMELTLDHEANHSKAFNCDLFKVQAMVG